MSALNVPEAYWGNDTPETVAVGAKTWVNGNGHTQFGKELFARGHGFKELISMILTSSRRRNLHARGCILSFDTATL